MDSNSHHISRVRLRREIAQVEKILEIAQDSERLKETYELCLKLMWTQKTNTFDAVDIKERIGQLRDAKGYEAAGGDMEATKTLEKDAEEFFVQTRSALRKARDELAGLSSYGNYASNHMSKSRLSTEIAQVEKILEAAQDPERLNEASDVSMELLKTEKTNMFDTIDISEYVGYRFDFQRERKANDIAAMKDSELGIKLFLEDIHSWMRDAKNELADLNSHRNYGSRYVSNTRLSTEIAQVEKILEAAQDPKRHMEASTLSAMFVKTQKTNMFDAMEVDDYVGYMVDIQTAEKSNDTEAMEASKEYARRSLDEIQESLSAAKNRLAELLRTHTDYDTQWLTKARLSTEIAQVEKILEAAQCPKGVNEAFDLSMEFLKTQKTNMFDAMEMYHYVGHMDDVHWHLAHNLNTAAAAVAKISAEEIREDTLNDLKIAKAKLEDMNKDAVGRRR
jgi:hypothetical protein